MKKEFRTLDELVVFVREEQKRIHREYEGCPLTEELIREMEHRLKGSMLQMTLDLNLTLADFLKILYREVDQIIETIKYKF